MVEHCGDSKMKDNQNGFTGEDNSLGRPYRGHSTGAFRNLDRNNGRNTSPSNRGNESGGLTPRHSSPSGSNFGSGRSAQHGLNQLGKAAGLTGKGGKLNQFGDSLNDIGKKDPNLDRAASGFNNARKVLPNISATSAPGQDGDMPGLTPKKSIGPQSGLPDPDKNPDRQRQPGNGDNEPNNNGMEDPLGKYGKYAPAALQRLGGKAGKAYGKTMSGFITGVQHAGKHVGLNLGKGAALKVVHSLMLTVLGAALFGIGWAYNNNNQVLNGDPVCTTQNTGSDSYEGNTGENGSGGDWTQKGTKEYKRAKELWDYCVHLGFTGTQCAAFLGNAAHEGGGFHNLAQDQIGGGGGKGIFQFTPGSKYDNDKKSDHSWSIKNQVDVFMDLEKAAFSQWYHQTKNSHDVDDCTNIFEKLIERGGIPDFDRRDAMAKKAYSMFHGSSVKGDASKIEKILGSSNAGTADDNSATAEAKNNANCEGKGNEPASASGVAGYAKAMIGWFNYSEGQRTDFAKNGDWKNISKLSQVNKNGHVDCTSFSWLCGRLAGYRMNGNNWPWTTQALSDPKSAGCKEVTNKSDVRAGDFGLNSNHGVVIVGSYKGGKTDAVDCGYDHVRHHSLAECYTGAGGWQSVRFFRPVTRR